MPNFDIRKYPQARLITPAISLGILTYCSWAYIDRLCVRHLLHGTPDHKAKAIVLITIYSVLTSIITFVWLQILLIGPGRQPRIPAYQLLDIPTTEQYSIPPPQIYQCDSNGYPIWCPVCNSVKALRSHHSSVTGYCVPRFDHYCSWLGAVTGYANYRLFMQFLMYTLMLCIVVIVSVVVCYLRMWSLVGSGSGSGSTRDGNLVALVVLAGFVFLFVSSLFVTHLYYIGKNQTSLEVLIVKSDKKSRTQNKNKNKNKNKGTLDHEVRSGVFVCFWDDDLHERYVVEISKGDLNRFWRKGTRWANFKNMLGDNILIWLLPFPTGKNSNDFVKDTERGEDLSSKEEGGEKIGKPFQTMQRDILGLLNEEINESSIQMLKRMIKQGTYVKKVNAYADRAMGW